MQKPKQKVTHVVRWLEDGENKSMMFRSRYPAKNYRKSLVLCAEGNVRGITYVFPMETKTDDKV